MKKIIQVVKLFDTSMLSIYQKFSDWFQKTFGPTNFSLARACLMCLCLLNLSWFVIPVIILKDFAFTTIILMVLVVIILFLGFRICTRSEREYFKKTRNNFLNKNEKTFFVWRIFSITFFIFRIIIFIQTLTADFSVDLVIIYGALAGHHIIIVHFFYFVSCTPLPPGESKVKAKLKKIREKVSGFLSPQPDATPV